MRQHETRLWLSACGFVVTSSLIAFLWMISLNMSGEFQAVLGVLLLLLGISALLAQGIFFLKGDIFDIAGNLRKVQIITSSAGILLIVQITFLFSNYAFHQIKFSQNGFMSAKQTFVEVQSYLRNNSVAEHSDIFSAAVQEKLLANRPELVKIVALDDQDKIIYPVAGLQAGQSYNNDKLDYYQFPLKAGSIAVEINREYNYQSLNKVIIELLTIMIVSVFLTIELLLFSIKIIEQRTFEPIVVNGKPPNQALSFVRQIAFLFYFSAGLVTSFIPVLAKSLGGSLFGLQGDTLASLPQSAEIFTTCIAIIFSGILLEKKGWKAPFLLGLFFCVIGSIASAFAPNILFFIVARMVTGLGYGFCWMTLRNFALFGRDEEEKGIGFSLLNAGLYAGLNCGVVLGGILAEKFGFKITMFISAAFTAACFLLVIGFRNAKYQHHCNNDIDVDTKGKTSCFEWLIVVFFMMLIVLPSCIINAFPTFYLPIYLTSLGYTIADVGRMQLLYGLIIVYVGPILVKKILQSDKLLNWNVISNVMFAGAIILFGIYGDFYAAMLAVAIIGMADSFGFVVQNNYFLRLKPILKIGESKALSYVSLSKKFYQMLGPMVFALFLSNGDISAIAIMGVGFISAAVIFLFMAKRYL